MMKHAVPILLAAALVCVAACKQETADTATDTASTVAAETTTESATHPASPGGTALVPDVSAGATVLVVVTEGSIAAKGEPIPPGPAVLTVENAGKEMHNLFIEGEGISRAAGDTIAPGSSSTVDVLFRPGKYLLYCPVLNHRENGEWTEINVQSDASVSDTAPPTRT